METTDQSFDHVVNIDILESMKASYLRYAMSVIVSRALPDVRDGLKPSQRRIIVSLNDLSLSPKAKYRKCAKIVGDTNGNYHPHGDAAVYQTLVRMAQNFSIRYPLVDGQGNFGSVDGDPPAAMRYTEARMYHPSMELVSDLEYNTVDFIPNYDESRTEPTVLPARFPNLMVNGSSGIAVGVATNIPPHNLTEVCHGLIHLVDHPECEVDDLMVHIKAPDFPTGGIICGREGAIEAYRTGKGRVTIRSKYQVEDIGGNKQQIVFTEIPYQVNKTTVIEKIVACIKEDKIKGIADVRDESDKDGMRLVIELKRNEDDQTIVNQLFQFTALQENFSINNIALVKGKPKRLNLKEFLEHFRDHRIEVIRRKTQFLLEKAEARAHILEGLRIAIDNIDAVIRIIRAAPDSKTAGEQLMESFGLSKKQTDAILEMQLRRLVGLEREKIEEEYREMLTRIADYKDILAKEQRVLDIIKEDLEDLIRKYGDNRRSEIAGPVGNITMEELIPDEDMAVLVSHLGYAKRIALNEFRTQGRGGKGVTGMNTHEDDFTEHLIVSSTKDYLLIFTNTGKVFWLRTWELPQMGRASKGRSMINLINIEKNEKVLAIIPVAQFDDRQLLMATSQGVMKKTALEAYSRPKKTGIRAIVLDEGDFLIDVKLTSGNEDIILSSRQGMSIRFPEKEARSMGRVSRGVKGMNLKEGDSLVSMNVVNPEAEILTICENGYGKKSSFEDFRTTHRGGKGVKTIANIERNGLVVGSLTVLPDDDVLVMTTSGILLRFSTSQLRTLGRATAGVRIISLRGKAKINAVTICAIKDEVEESEEKVEVLEDEIVETGIVEPEEDDDILIEDDIIESEEEDETEED